MLSVTSLVVVTPGTETVLTVLAQILRVAVRRSVFCPILVMIIAELGFDENYWRMVQLGGMKLVCLVVGVA